MQDKISILRKELENQYVESSVAEGTIVVKVNGKQEIVDIQIDKKYLNPDDSKTLEDLIKTATNKAINESQEMVAKAMSKLANRSHTSTPSDLF